MRIARIQLICFIILFAVFSCNLRQKQPAFSDSLVEPEQFDLKKYWSAIRYETEILPDTADTICCHLKKWYALHNFEPVWITSPVDTSKTDTLINWLSRIEVHGILPSQLGTDSIQLFYNKLKKNNFSYLELAKLEIKSSLAYLKYCGGLKFGFVNPHKNCKNYYFRTLQIDSAFIDSCFTATRKNLNNFLDSIQPHSKEYLALVAEKQKWKRLKDSTFTPIPLLPGKETIKPGDTHPAIPPIARRLMITGELPYSTSYKTIYTTFDHKILKALNAFRNHTNLEQDRLIGNKTIDALNFTFVSYLDKINANLERLRWKPAKLGGPKHICVNVADMTLTAFRHDTTYLTMKICVGKPETETPFLQGRIHELVLNPTWTVPNSIIIKEYTKIGVTDSGYFRRHFIRAYKYGAEVDPAKINWIKINKANQPYKFVQDSGDINSLGRIKFNFYNKFSIYLHDTNSKSAFLKSNRAVSHGCIRVEKPLELACFCLPDIESTDSLQLLKRDWLTDKIRYTIGLKPVSKTGSDSCQSNPASMRLGRIALHPDVPVLIDYRTCILNLQGKVIFCEDIYNLDQELTRLLKQKKL